MRTLQEFALPRRRSIEMFREAVWAVAQHYDVWPTPLIDVHDKSAYSSELCT